MRRLTPAPSQRRLYHACRIVLAAVVVSTFAAGAHAQTSTLPADTESILDLIVQTARHADLRDVAFIEKTFKVVLKREEQHRSDGSVRSIHFGPTPLPFATGRSFLSLVIRTPPTAFAGEYQVGELSIVLIDTVPCVPRLATEQRMTSAFGKKRTAEVSHGPPQVFYKAIEDTDRIIYVDTLFDVQAECLASVQIRHRL